MGEQLHPQALVLVRGKAAPVMQDVDVEGAGAEKLHLRELPRDKRGIFLIDLNKGRITNAE